MQLHTWNSWSGLNVFSKQQNSCQNGVLAQSINWRVPQLNCWTKTLFFLLQYIKQKDFNTGLPWKIWEAKQAPWGKPSGATALLKPEQRMGTAREPRACGHQGKAKARRKARVLSELLPNAENEEKSQAAPFFQPAYLLSTPSLDFWN